jgi:hypothetical protein
VAPPVVAAMTWDRRPTADRRQLPAGRQRLKYTRWCPSLASHCVGRTEDEVFLVNGARNRGLTALLLQSIIIVTNLMELREGQHNGRDSNRNA